MVDIAHKPYEQQFKLIHGLTFGRTEDGNKRFVIMKFLISESQGAVTMRGRFKGLYSSELMLRKGYDGLCKAPTKEERR